MCPFPLLVQYPSGDDDEGDPRLILRWATNWRTNGQRTIATLMTSSCWLFRKFGGRITGVRGLPTPSQPQIQLTLQCRQGQGNGERRHT